MVAALAAACTAAIAFAAAGPPLAGVWNIAPTGSAGSSGDLIFRVSRGDGSDPVEITVPVHMGADQASIARGIRSTLSSQLGRSRYQVELGEGGNILVSDPRGQPNFSLELLDSDVDGLRVAVQSVTPAAAPTVPPQNVPAAPAPVAPPANNLPGNPMSPPNNSTVPTPTMPPAGTSTPAPPGTPVPNPNAPVPNPNAPVPNPNAPVPSPSMPVPNPSPPPNATGGAGAPASAPAPNATPSSPPGNNAPAPGTSAPAPAPSAPPGGGASAPPPG
jgi:hypothetical protein